MSELGPEARDILCKGREGDEPSPADRVRIRSALMAAIAAGTAATAADQAAADTAHVGADAGLPASVGAAKPIAVYLIGNTLAKGILSILLGAVGIGAIVAWPRNTPTKMPTESPVIENPAVVMPTAVEAAPSTSIADRLLEQQSALPVVATVPALPLKPLPARTTASAPAPRANEKPADSLIVETQRLRDAHGALQGGDPEKALALLSDQAAEAEGQKLREERAAARVIALCKLGRVDEANAEATAFLAQNPRSPLAARVRNACATSR